MKKLINELYPICRSITGEGLRKSLKIISSKFNTKMKIHSVPSGTKVFDWVVPNEWNIRDAWVKDPFGNKLIDFNNSNLHVMGYSEPVDKHLSWEELYKKLYVGIMPKRIPYRTSYYKRDWGFCSGLQMADYESTQAGIVGKAGKYKDIKKSDCKYHAYIDSTLEPGHLNYGEVVIPGKSNEEILFSTYLCHPSMCNDNLSGPAIHTKLIKKLEKTKNYYTYRFIFIPETIGAICWLHENQKRLDKYVGGFVTTCAGDNGPVTYKKTRSGSIIDDIVQHVLEDYDYSYIRDYSPLGSDERQFSSPGFDMPIGTLMRTPPGEFSEYHNSDDNIDFISEKKLNEIYSIYSKIIVILEKDYRYLSSNLRCEPNFGKRGLYNKIGATTLENDIKAYKWIMNYSDGHHTLFDIAKLSNFSFTQILSCSKVLERKGLITKCIK